MLEKYSRYRILQEFFRSPTTDFQMREISRRTNISQPSVMKHLSSLVEDGFVFRHKRGIYPSFRANRDSELFRVYKRSDMILEILKSGLIDCIYDDCMPDAIVLFGSASKGEDIEGSDIDLFVQSPEKRLKLEKYEKVLGRSVSLFFGESFQRLSAELKNNILNGILLRGYLKVF